MRISNSSLSNKIVSTRLDSQADRKEARQTAGALKEVFQKQSRQDNVLSALIAQKQRLAESKNTLMAEATKNGGGLGAIKGKLDSLDKQIKEIDSQIVLEQQKSIEDRQKKAKQADKDSSGGNQAEGGNMSALTELSGDLSSAAVINSVKTNLSGRVKVLNREIETDEARSASGQSATHKRGEVEKIEGRISSLDRASGKALQSVHRHMEDLANTAVEDGTAQKDTENTPESRQSNGDTKNRLDITV